MATLANTHNKYFQMLRSLVFNPGQKFITAADELNFINAAAVTVAARLGGLFFVDSTQTTLASVSSYILPNHIRKIRYLELVDTTVTPNTVQYVDVVSYEAFRSIAPDANSQPFAWFRPETGELFISPAPLTDGLQIRLLCWGLPNALVDGSQVLFDGDLTQLNAVSQEAASLIRIKTRDVEEGGVLHARAMESVESAASMISTHNQVDKLQVGRHTHPNRLRRF